MLDLYNQPIPEVDFVLPSELERQQIFYWLQKVSSLTAWRRIFEHYKAWITVTENSVREAERQGWSDKTSLSRNTYLRMSKGIEYFKKGIIQLENTDRRPFETYGYFTDAKDLLFMYAYDVRRVDEGENGIDEEHTPFWQEYCEAMSSACSTWHECAYHMVEPRYFGDGLRSYNQWLKNELKLTHFPPQLDTVPEPEDHIFVRANGFTPYAGIWEPVAAPEQSFGSRLTGAWKPQPPFEIVGAMAYFHPHSRAPRIRIGSEDKCAKLNMAWRLLWRDDRYADGTVPEKEAQYRFLEPERSKPKSSGPPGIENVIWAESGAAAQVAGKWTIESDTYSVTRKKAQRLPFVQGRSYRWILAQRM